MSERQSKPMMEPSAGHSKIPLWIKVMWVFGIAWVIGYVFFGLQHTPTTW